MGLDMYLTRKKYVGAEWEHRNVKGKIKITIGDKELPIDFSKVSYIDESVAYWRKANAIHKWFVENVQKGVDDCGNYYVSKDDLEKLLNVCKEVKEKAVIKKGMIQNGTKMENGEWKPVYEEGEYIENGDELEAILPTESGFFFGSTAYDQWYMMDIDYTIKRLEELLKEEKEMNDIGFWSEFEYHASW